MRAVRIDDLREPQRSREEQSVYEFALSMDVDLDPGAMVAEARAATGLSDFGEGETVYERAA